MCAPFHLQVALVVWPCQPLQGYKGLVEGGDNISEVRWEHIQDIMQKVCGIVHCMYTHARTHTLIKSPLPGDASDGHSIRNGGSEHPALGFSKYAGLAMRHCIHVI